MKLHLLLTSIFTYVTAQISWTPIFIDGNSQVDLWTQESHGCRCSFDSKRQDCACCAKDGGCPCGRTSPHRCTQCGLEDYCANSCNMTIDSRVLAARSGKSFGQIKSPSLEGPGSCYYILQPLHGQRVELQIYRLVSVGKFNNSRCNGGYLQIQQGLNSSNQESKLHICGVNERYSPPVVVFSDHGSTTLVFRIMEATARSQFLAFFSFTSVVGNQGLQFKGGHRLNHSECEWLYQDFACRTPNSCILVTPGYPGIYPPNLKCKYHITTSSIHTRVRISFTSILLPYNRCKTDYIAIYQGSTSANPQLIAICNKTSNKIDMEHVFSGPNLFLQFSSGVTLPPYNYNGFRATLEFTEKTTTTESSINFTLQTTEAGVLSTNYVGETSAPRVILPKSNCDINFSGNGTRSGTFDTRSRSWSSTCVFTFVGTISDVVHVSFFNYNLKATSCQSSIEIYEGYAVEGTIPLRLCSPLTKHARESSTGRFVEPEHHVSPDNVLTIVLKRTFPTPFDADVEFLDGAFLFHDEHVDGTLQPSTLCDVDYYGLSSSSTGHVTNPGSQALYFNIQKSLKCSQRFFPATNQSITLSVTFYNPPSADPHCHTVCGDSFCRCSHTLPLEDVDHLLIQTDNDYTLLCLCGPYQPDWLPLTFQSWSPLKLVYSVAQYTWEKKGFNFTTNYTFNSDSMCGHHTLTSESGTLEALNTLSIGQPDFYYHQNCTWLLDSKAERQLNIIISTAQTRLCSSWNISIHEYDEESSDRAGKRLHIFCPQEKHKIYELSIDLVVIRLQATSITLPSFHLEWQSNVGHPNTRTSDLHPSPNKVSLTILSNLLAYLIPIFIIIFML